MTPHTVKSRGISNPVVLPAPSAMAKRGEEEKVPLLEPRAPAAAGDGGNYSKVEEEEEEENDSSLSLGRRAWEENKKLWVVAGPSIFTRFSSFGVTVISQAFIGHIGATELAAYAFVSTVLMRFSNGILFGIVVQHHIGAPHRVYEECRDCTWCSFNMWQTSLELEVQVRAKFAILNVVTISFLIGFVLFVLFLFFRGSLAYIFTESQAVDNAVADLSPLLAFSILLNSVQPVLSGVAVGAGWQSVVAYVNITSYYLIGIPLGAVLGYVVGFHVKGIWIGMLLGTLVQTIVLLFITLRTDWEKQIAQERLKRWYMEENRRLQASRGNP